MFFCCKFLTQGLTFMTLNVFFYYTVGGSNAVYLPPLHQKDAKEEAESPSAAKFS